MVTKESLSAKRGRRAAAGFLSVLYQKLQMLYSDKTENIFASRVKRFPAELLVFPVTAYDSIYDAVHADIHQLV